VLKKLSDVMVVVLNTEDKSPCNDLSLCVLVSSTVIEIKILLVDKILDHFVRNPVIAYLAEKYRIVDSVSPNCRLKIFITELINF
jgi:hypothetical protein